MTVTAPLLEARSLAYATPDGRPLVRGLSFKVAAGEMVAVTGPNGVGKSTLMRVVLGELKPREGAVVTGVAAAKVGFLSQLHNREFHLPLTLRDVLALGVRGRLDDAKALSFGLLEPAHLKRAWNTASGGERQKTLLTQVLLQDPALLVLDEPLNHLDVAGRFQLRDTLRAWVKGPGRGVMMVAHEKIAAMEGWEIAAVVDLREYRAA